MREIQLAADRLVAALLNLPEEYNLCLFDSGGAAHLGSHLLMAGFNPTEVSEINEPNPELVLEILNEKLARKNLFAFFTIGYEFGLKLAGIHPRRKEFSGFDEPDVFLASFDVLIVHDYDAKKTFLAGNEKKFNEIEKTLSDSTDYAPWPDSSEIKISSNFTKNEYLEAVEKVKERIRRGDTYQTNLTRQIRAELPADLTPEQIFRRLRKNHPAPFAAFLRRKTDVVVSASPERFFKFESGATTNDESKTENRKPKPEKNRIISVSPIKGTRRRGRNAREDFRLKNELLNSEKDRAENVMIVDLMRNDLGRICEFGSVRVEKLCDLESHPTLFHLVSTVAGRLRADLNFGDILKAVFPCGSITGAPKISTMRIIDELETAPRGLSMGAIGYSIQNPKFKIRNQFDLSVAIRTMIVRGREAVFNVGGGIVIDSVAENEYEETEVKARALLSAIYGKFI